MRILTAILSSFAAASICTLAQARVIDTSVAYTNPTTVPLILGLPSTTATYTSGYHGLPATLDLAPFFKEVTSPGPVLTFTVNTPTTIENGASAPNTFKVELWILDPTPETPVANDSNFVSDADDTRVTFQNLDLNEPFSIGSLVDNAIGYKSPDEATLPGTIFWDAIKYMFSAKDIRPVMLQCGAYQVATDGTTHVTYSGCSWTGPNFFETNYTAGTAGLYYSSLAKTYSLAFNLEDNTTIMPSNTFATIGKVDDTGLELLKTIAGRSSSYKLATCREASSVFTNIPLWNTYTNDDYEAFKQPATDDYVKIKSVTMSDLSGTYPTHGLKFLEDQPYNSSTTASTVTLVDPNSAIKKIFNISLTPEGLLTFTPRDDVSVDSSIVATYYFFFRVYVNDGTNTGLAGTDYFRTYASITVTNPFTTYIPNAYRNSSASWGAWYNSATYGWYLVNDFPNTRWVYSPEHGWLYMYGDCITDTAGVDWYNAPSSYPTSSSDTTYVDDEAGWLWTRSDFYPYFYSHKDKGWVCYIKDTAPSTTSTDTSTTPVYNLRMLGNRLFWSDRQKAYITPSGKDTTFNSTTVFPVNGRKFGTGL